MNKEEFIRRFQHIRQVKPEADFPLLKAGKPAAVLIPIIERADATILPLANVGWSDRPGGERPLYVQAGNKVTGRSIRPERKS